ncbi:MAG: 5-amino-6-(D-ribitylamino)uracil--L-tyrosine 4-hydroxyphenyl transferase CofH [Hyphomicrobiaceae bacterium]
MTREAHVDPMASAPTRQPQLWAIVPVKALDSAKQRLSGVLEAGLRRRLVLTMLEDVLATLGRQAAITQMAVVTRDAQVAAVAARFGAIVVREPDGADLNASIVCGLETASAAGAVRALIVPGDVPLAGDEDIQRVLAATRTPEAVVIAPASDGDGTNALLLPLPAPLQPAFGPGSASRHTGLARIGGRTVFAVGTAGLAHDIDTADDLDALAGRARYAFLDPAFDGGLPAVAAHALTEVTDIEPMLARAEALTVAGHGTVVTYSKKVFIPLTKLCRDVCHYCTFAHAPREVKAPYLSADEVLAIARAGKAQGCKEALFTLGDKPELRYQAARDALAALGYESTLAYLEAMAALVLKETGLLPHLNPGLMDEVWMKRLREVSISQGIMLETASARLSEKGGPHYGSPDKDPAARLETIEAAGRAKVPFTTGILIGIGETRTERIDAFLAIRGLHQRFGHIQEVIIQNFRAKPDTKMAAAPEPSLDEHLWTIAAARLIFGPAMNIQAPPNLQPDALANLVRAGINDWGGVSPVTPDHVNPERPWPHLEHLASATALAGRTLAERTALYPEYVLAPEPWIAKPLKTPLLRLVDAGGRAREDAWAPGDASLPPPALDAALIRARRPARSAPVAAILDRLMAGRGASEAEISALFCARGDDFSAVCHAADARRQQRNGDTVSYVVVRNINYTNICTYGCKFCAFSKGKLSTDHRDKPYILELEEVAERTREAWSRGATEVCLQGGIAPRYTGDTYLAIAEAVKIGAPDIHVHAFSPLEVWHGATTLKLPLQEYLTRLKAAGLSSLPGTAAEILDDEVRQILCPDKITTDQWLEVMEAAHAVGLKSTATIMFGHVDHPRHWARHLMRVRALQERTGGFTELVPLAFVHMESPIYLRGQSRKGPTFREAVLMHAVARLVLDPVITNIQASWVKMGPEGAALCLAAGANDLGGTLMNESITRAAGAAFGQEMTAPALERLIREAGRLPRQRTTFYGDAPEERQQAAAKATPAAGPGMIAAE